MWIRYRAARFISPSQGVFSCRFGELKYLFPMEAGLCDIPNKEHIAALLAQRNLYEIAYEKYGIHFNEDGMEIQPGVPSFSQPQSTVTHSEAVEVPPPNEPKMSISARIKKMQEARNRKRIEQGKHPIEFKS